MEPSESAASWRRAYARQALSDFEVYDHICTAQTIPECQRLHYLQMALEKSAKAFFWNGPGSNIDASKVKPSTNRIHDVVATYLPVVYIQHRATVEKRISGSARRDVKLFCQEVDLLAPANAKKEKVDGKVQDAGKMNEPYNVSSTRPDNCEYPWEVLDSTGAIVCIQSPLDYEFTPTRLMRMGGAVLDFIRVIRTKVREMSE